MPTRKRATASESFIVDIDDPVLGRLLRGGLALPHDSNYGLVVLLRGKPGTGKSTLALQLLDLIRVEASRCYCTLEQSKADLKYKLASMLVARAIRHARQPRYQSKKGEKFVCDWGLFVRQLGGRLRRQAQRSRMKACLHRDVLPLYEEPTSRERRTAADVQTSLATLVAEDLKEKRIAIFDGRSDAAKIPHEGPLGATQSRVILASRILDEAEKAAYGRQGRTAKARAKRPVVVVDGLSLLSTPERETLELQRLVEEMRRRFQIGILVYEPNEDESTSLDHQADIVIELARRTIEKPLAYAVHELCVRKARYQEAALGQHQFKIRGWGIEVFPSLHFQVHHYNYMDLELRRSAGEPPLPTRPKSIASAASFPPCESGSLIDLISNPQEGESIVLLGSRNSFKTQLCLDFLARGCWSCPEAPARGQHVEKGLLISLIDNAPDIERGLYCPWTKYLKGACPRSKRGKCGSGLLTCARPFCQRPGCITPGEFFHYVQERIQPTSSAVPVESPCVSRVVFWDLTQMDYRFPLFKEDKMLLPALMDMFKTKRLKSLFMGAGNAENTRAASAMADHVIFCWRSPSIPEAQKGRRGTRPLSSLMLYVDRTSMSSQQSGKALYRIPVYRGDAREVLEVPLCRTDLITPRYRLEPSDPGLKAYDRDQIRRVTNMQGVA